MVDHFHEQVLALNNIGGEARAMVVILSDLEQIRKVAAARRLLTFNF